MEADVAIHSAEKWSAPEASCFEQKDEAKFVYSSRLKEREARHLVQQKNMASQYILKPSKSYDNELEARIGKEANLYPKTQHSNVKDDFGLGYMLCTEEKVTTSPFDYGQSSATASAFCIPFHIEIQDSAGPATTLRDKVNYKGKKAKVIYSDLSTKESNDFFFDVLQHSESNKSSTLETKAIQTHVSDMVVPVEFHFQKDQREVATPGPKFFRQRPTTLLSSSSLATRPITQHQARHKEKTSPMVILEVKDGPTLFYKPSDKMMTDACIEVTDCFKTPIFSDFNKTTFCPEKSKYVKRSALSSEDSPKSSALAPNSLNTGSPSLLPRALGLRRPDLSLLKKSSKDSPERCVSEANGARNECQQPHRTAEHALITAVPGPQLFISRTSEHVNDVVAVGESLAFTPVAEDKKPVSNQTDIVLSHTQISSSQSPSALSQATKESIQLMTVSSHTPTPPTKVLGKQDSAGFLNTSEIIQQKAGIKHDDIVVGPHKQFNTLLCEPHGVTGSAGNKEDIVFEPFVGGESLIDKPYIPPPKPVSGIPQRHKKKPPEPLIFTEQSTKEVRIKSDVKAVRSQEILPTKVNANPSNSVESGPPSSAENSLERMTAVGGSLDRGRWRPREKKTGIHRLSRERTADLCHSLEKTKVHGSQLSPKPCGSSDQFGRYSKLSLETKQLSKSTSSSPARQKPLPSPHTVSQKTKLPKSSAPAKKQQPSPSRLNMLSNIPVPMSHDPPARRATNLPQKVQSKPQQPETSSCTDDHQLSNSINAANDSVKIIQFSDGTDGNSNSYQQEQTITEHQTQEELIKQESHSSDIKIEKTEEKSYSLTSTPTAARKKLAVLIKKNSQITKSSSASKSNEEVMSSVALTDSEAKHIETQPPLDGVIPEYQPHTPPAKPRLHRSAEHLVGEAKLTVFNSTDNIQRFENSGTEAKSLQDPDKLVSVRIGQLKKDKSLAKIGILRRGSDRTEMYRRGSDRGIPISRNDPSVEDLKKATSLKELCQSVASLLNIDNEKAAEMITTSLSQRQDLVEGLDADAILDYLSHHGVLDPAILVGLDKNASSKQRNSTIIRHVEEHGTTAVALFINALRQSGQLHLASSLDTEQRIKPVSGDGYFGKQRHKGEVTVRVEIESLKILAPREPRTDRIVDATLLSSPTHHTGNTPEAADEAEDDDVVKPKCWCFCFSHKNKAKKVQSSKKGSEKHRLDAVKEKEMLQEMPLENSSRTSGHEEVDRKNPNVKPHRTKSKEKNKKDKDSGTRDISADSVKSSNTEMKQKDGKKHKSKSKPKQSSKYSASDHKYVISNQEDVMGKADNISLPEDSFDAKYYQTQQVTNDIIKSSSSNGKKDSWDPIVMEYDPKLELVKLRAGHDELASPTRQCGQLGMMCEQWKSSGRHYLQKATALCNSIIQELHTEIIKYFEQDRSTLVLDVTTDGSAILISNICMQKAQVTRLQNEVEDGSLISKIEDMFFSKVDITSFDIRGVKLKIVLDDHQVITALSELS